jgi:alpha-glucuronidase
MKLPSRLLLAALMIAAMGAHAEDGYDLWLRYRPMRGEWLKSYRESARELVPGTPSATLNVAQSELARGLGGLLGVQLYVYDVVSSVTRPVKELKGFRRVTLAPGQATTVQFTLDSEAFALWDEQMKHVVEPGAFEIMVGPNSVDLKTATLDVTS